jgi:hypothetical protein
MSCLPLFESTELAHGAHELARQRPSIDLILVITLVSELLPNVLHVPNVAGTGYFKSSLNCGYLY